MSKGRCVVPGKMVIGCVAASAILGFMGDGAFGQEHGIGATKGCVDRCAGETTNCTATAVYLDENQGDIIRVLQAWDTVHATGGDVRVPAAGNLPIIQVIGNALCTDSGGACNPATGANCVLPCLLGGPGDTGEGLPGLGTPGRAQFSSSTYVIQPGDGPNLGDTVRFEWEDLCGSGATNCPLGTLVTPAGSNTDVIVCDDLNPCTRDICTLGVCTVDPDCESDADCPDPQCGEGVCVNSCCETVPECDDNEDCDDGNSCTRDDCVDGCCRHVPDCEIDANCTDDGDLCTVEFCDTATSCCDVRDVECEPDSDPCTLESCDSATGDCVSTPIEPPPPGCEEGGDGCTPGFWKQPHHLQFWCDAYSPEDHVDDVFGVTSTGNPTLLKALSTGGGGEIAFLRHAVAALLNSCHDEVDYAFSTATVIEMVQDAYESGDFATPHGEFEEENERGCTVDKSGAVREGGLRGNSQLNKNR